ncbi:unnamed protein product [Parascedosporium putredinis]|uniref:SGNH hydrolase-type esterase domain-containing protein n=1 Tax=Parascedosporium putredinis TaxID=1442378 RepID=A0A9P1MCR2_9PEZI|nr:unnamed protein product [Parascedosporium putredinis]CAI7998278.1 unnamed protein product [Parascedosporium putredinis]
MTIKHTSNGPAYISAFARPLRNTKDGPKAIGCDACLAGQEPPHDQEIDECHPHPEPVDAGFFDTFSRLKLDSNMPMGAEMDTAMALNVADPTSGFPLHLTQRIELSSQHDDFFPGDAAAMLTPSAPHSAAIFPSTTTVTDGQTAAAPDVGGPHNQNTAGLRSHRGLDGSPSMEADPCSLGPFLVQNISVVRITFLTSIAMFGGLPSKKCTRAEKKWLSIWGSMPQLTEPHNLPRRIRLSTIDVSTVKKLTFSGNDGFVIPNGASVLSDPIDFPVKAQSIVSIDIYLEKGQTTNEITSHPGSRTTSWFVKGNAVGTESLEGAANAAHWYFISSIEGQVKRDSSAVVIVGDSITDGRGSTTDKNDRWPDQLLTRMKKDGGETQNIAVINQAAGGNRVLADGLGPNALGRIDRDVIAMPGTKYAIIYEGVNDIGTAATDEASQQEVENRLVAAYDQIITRLHRFNIAVFGATITPILGEQSPYNNTVMDATRQRVNEWIRTSGRFDAVIDFDEAVRDAENPEVLSAQYDSGDGLHLSPAGYKAMAAAVDLSLFKRYKNGP